MLQRSLTQYVDPSSPDADAFYNATIRVLAWGDDGSGQCLGGSRSSLDAVVSVPALVRIPGDKHDFIQLGAGWEQSFLVAASGRLWGGGSNRGACLLQDADMEQVIGIRALSPGEACGAAEDFEAAAVAAGREHFVAIRKDGAQLLTWSCSNEFGQTGQGAERVGLGSCIPRGLTLQPGVRVNAVSCGQDHVLALTERGEVFSWGDGSVGQLGLPPAKWEKAELAHTESAPQRLEAGALRGLPIRQIAAGEQHSLALGISGQVIAWGSNKHGRLGLGVEMESTPVVHVPTAVEDLPGSARSLSAGGRHSAAVLRGGRVFLAGDNRRGQLGHPPEQLSGSSLFLELPFDDYSLQVRAVVLGQSHTLLLTNEGIIYGVGQNDRGQLGEPLADSIFEPKRLALPSDRLVIWAVSAGRDHSLVLASEAAEFRPGTADRPASVKRQRTAADGLGTLPRGAIAAAPDEDADDDSPLIRTKAHHGLKSSPSEEALTPPAGAVEVPEEEITLERLRSAGCSSRAVRGSRVEVPMLPISGLPDAADGQGMVLIKPVVRPGVASGIVFACLAVDELSSMVKALPASDQEACAESGPPHLHLSKTVAAILRCPTVLGASFLFQNLNEARLNSSALCEQLHALRLRTHCDREAFRSWLEATSQGLRLLAPGGGILRKVRTRDQIRALVLYLMLPDWPTLLADFHEKNPSIIAKEAFTVGCEVLRTLARLPIDGRAAFRDIVADECADIKVLKNMLLPAARALANATLFYCSKTERLEACTWDAVLLLQLLYAADMKRLEVAAEAARAARSSEGLTSALSTERAAISRMGRSLSRTTSALGRTSTLVYTAAPAESVALPRSCFEISALTELPFPPGLELQMFRNHAKMQTIDPMSLCKDAAWELDPSHPGDGLQTPLPFRSFMAHGNLISLVYKREVLQAENMERQAQEQTRQVLGGNNANTFALFMRMGMPVPAETAFFVMEVKRSDLLSDTARILRSTSPDNLRKPLKVKFEGEQGVDEGGVSKEFFRLLTAQLFGPEYGMFKADEESRYLWFEPMSFTDPEDFQMVGMILGLAVYNNLPGLDVNLPLAVFKKLKKLPVTMSDFQQAFPSHAASLQAVLDWKPAPGTSPEEADKLFQDIFCLDFSVSVQAFGEVKTIPLLAGADPPPPVTYTRRQEFADAYVQWYLTTGVETPFEAFMRGFGLVCGSPVFDGFSARELEAIVCGEKDLDFDNLKKGCAIVDTPVKFRSGYLEDFWKILLDFDANHKRQFLKFLSGSDLAPIGGLERLKLKIQRNDGEPTCRLPTAHTCFNLLMLPEYESAEKLKRLLIAAIENADGFGLE
eukprot:TRINITY_DN18867_c0_g1_i1.p1 TRINITY_DN18867_c0_g1~~TRINITY_DN18867_c0_g1_i1.p1  ORF type:complete len:1329 (-),score=281.95 TRINITY_DN18867_c0_g1_i1:290-4276(-)